MLLIIILVVGFSSIYFSRIWFGKWFNHVAIYASVWMVMLYLFELRLIYFIELSIYTWLIIIGSFLSFLFGSITVLSARGTGIINSDNAPEQLSIFLDKGKILRNVIYLFSLIGLLSAIQHWSVLLNEYGTVINVFLNAYHVYKSRTSGELEGVIPYVWLIIYPTIFFAGIYTAYRNKITIATILPIVALILKEVANLSRAGILFGFAEFVISYMLFRHLLKKNKSLNKSSKLKAVGSVVILLLLFVTGAAFIKSVRQATDTFKGTSSSLAKFEGGAFISPSIYFYAASHVAVFNQYLEADRERESFGSNTFFTLYSALAKFDLVKQPRFIQPGYFIPAWSNTGTYLRELYNDFGVIGTFIFPFLLGLFSSFYWVKFYESGKIKYLVILTHLYIVIAISFFVLVVRSPAWTIGGVFLLSSIPIIEKLISRKVLS